MPERICTADGCDRPHKARGWCEVHYSRWYDRTHPGGHRSRNPGARADQYREELRTGIRVCKVCKVGKPLDAFSPSKMYLIGRAAECRPCRSATQRARYTTEVRRTRHQQRALTTRQARDRYLRREYGLSLSQYEAMLEAQGGLCAICRRDRKLVVDHCHTKGNVRQLLCSQCNTALGLAGEDESVLRSLIDYLGRHGS